MKSCLVVRAYTSRKKRRLAVEARKRRNRRFIINDPSGDVSRMSKWSQEEFDVVSHLMAVDTHHKVNEEMQRCEDAITKLMLPLETSSENQNTHVLTRLRQHPNVFYQILSLVRQFETEQKSIQ